MIRRLESVGLTIEYTGAGKDREMQTIRLDGAYVAGICYSTQTDREGTVKSGFWVDFVARNELTNTQCSAIKQYLKREALRYQKMIFGGQK